MSTLIKTYGVDHGLSGARDASGTGRDLRDSVESRARERSANASSAYGLVQALAVAALLSAAIGYASYLAIAGWRFVL